MVALIIYIWFTGIVFVYVTYRDDDSFINSFVKGVISFSIGFFAVPAIIGKALREYF